MNVVERSAIQRLDRGVINDKPPPIVPTLLNRCCSFLVLGFDMVRRKTFFSLASISLTHVIAVVWLVACAVCVAPLAAFAQDDYQSLVEQQNQFSLAAFRELRSSDENLFCSPSNIYDALALLEPGASGKTQQQIASILFPTGAVSDSQFASLHKRLTTPATDGKFELRYGASAWFDQSISVRPAFQKAMSGRGLHEPIRSVRFAGDAARVAINRWASDATNSMIPELLADKLSPTTKMVLCSAVYFNGKWASPFQSRRTRPGRFERADGKTIGTPMMWQTSTVKYARNDRFTIGSLAYGSGRMELVLVIPHRRDGLDNVVDTASANDLNQWIESMKQERRVKVGLPKFQMRSKLKLKAALTKMGANLMFEEQADFSKIAGGKLTVSSVIHEAVIKVDEQGTEAAAATAIIARTPSGPSPKSKTLIADRPFLFLIRDSSTGLILFMGQMASPEAAK